MVREVNIWDLNRAYVRALFSLKEFWVGAVLYVFGVACLVFSLSLGGFIMLIAALIMINADWYGKRKVLRNLQWKK